MIEVFPCKMCGKPVETHYRNQLKYCPDCRLARHRDRQKIYAQRDQFKRKAGQKRRKDPEPVAEVERTRPIQWQHLTPEEFEARANRLLALVSEKGRMPMSLSNPTTERIAHVQKNHSRYH